MTFGRDKRLLLGLLALAAPLPLPFNDAVEWPVALAYSAGVLLFLRRAHLDPPRWLPVWAMNALGLAYLPLFFFDLLVLGRGRLVGPVLHLCLFSVLVKLFSMSRERDKWQAVLGVFFLFLAAMGTSVHPSIVLYLVGVLGLGLAMLTRFAWFHVLAGFGREDAELARTPPLAGFFAVATLGVLAVSVPLFAVLPRVRAPFIVGRGAGTGMQIEAAGFSDDVTLDSIGRIRGSREVALRLQQEGAGSAAPDEEMRFKAATYDLYQDDHWRRSPKRASLTRGRGVRYRLGRQAARRWVKIWLQPMRSRSLPLPVESVVVEPRASSLVVDEGGAVSLPVPALEVLEYRAGLADRPVDSALPPRPADPALDTRGVTFRMAELALRVMGRGTAEARARRLELYLNQNYTYTVDFVGRSGGAPLEDFLFRYKSGHCEYFASAMVLLLRSQGVPARLVTGFLGGEYNPFEGYYIVRDSNAHAWVEAYLPGRGWQIFDPTPPAGRPAVAAEGAWLLARQAYDFLLFRWDRYVLTFGIGDQLEIFRTLYGTWLRVKRLFHAGESPAAETGAPAGEPGPAPAPAPAAAEPFALSPLWLLALVAVAAALALLRRRYRPPLTAEAAYRRLRQRLARAGGRPFPDSLPPLALRGIAQARHPAAAAPAATIVDLYVREAYAGRALAEDERRELEAALAEAERGLRKAG